MNTFYLKKQVFQKTLLALCYTFFIFLLPFVANAQLNCAGVTFNTTPAVCPGTGEINVTLPANFGGAAPYTFSFVSGTIGTTAFSSQSGMPIESLNAGTYSISIDDFTGTSGGCVIPNIIIPTTYIPMQNPVASWIGCQAQVNIVGGKPPYTIDVINPSTPNAPPLSSITNFSNTTYTFSNLSNGAKAIKITDACGKTVTSANGLINYVPIVLNTVFTQPDKVDATVVSATNSLYTYKLYTNNILQETKVTIDKNVTFTNVITACNGNYVVVSDTSCSDTKTTPFTTPNATPILTVNCVNFANGTASISATGGKLPYTYECFNNLGVKIADSNTGNFTGITATSVFFKVKDACGIEVISSVHAKPILNIYNALADCANSKVTLAGDFQTSGTAPLFVPLTFTGLSSTTYNSTSTTANFTKNDIPTNFVLEIKDKCDNGFKIKDSIKFDFLPNQPCKTIKTGSINYLIKYVNGPNIGFYSFAAAPNSLTYELYNDASVLVATNSTGVFTNISYAKNYTVKVVTPCGLTTTKTTEIPLPTGILNPIVLYTCIKDTLKGIVLPTGLTAPMSITSVPPGTPAAIDTPLPLGTYLIEDCTGSKLVEIKASNAPTPTPVTYTLSSKCVNNEFKHTIVAGSNNLGSGPYILQDTNGGSMPSTGNDGKTFKDLDAGTYTLTSLNNGCTAPTQIILVDPPTSTIYDTLEGPFCNNGVFFWNITNINSFHVGLHTLTDAAGNSMPSANLNGTVYENLTAGKYYINGQCATKKEIDLVNPPLTSIPYSVSLDCKNGQLLYKIIVTDIKLKPFKLKLGGTEMPNQEEGAYTTFIDLVPGNYILTGGCSTDTPIPLPNFPTMPKISATITGNCPTDTYLKADVGDIGKIWADWFLSQPTISYPLSFTTCGGGSKFLLTTLGTTNTFNPNPNSTVCNAGKYSATFDNIPSGNYELALSFCGYSDKVNIYIPPHIHPIVKTTRGVVCTLTDKTDITINTKSNSFPIKIELMTCGSSIVKEVLATNYQDTVFVHKNLPIGPYCYRITDACGFSESGTTAIALLGSIRPNYRDSCGYVVLYMDKLLGATYEWTSPPSNAILSTTEKLIVKAETFVRDFQVKVALPNNTICTRSIKIKKNSGISPIPLIDKTQLTTCEANGKIPLSVKINNDVPDEFVTLIEWLDESKAVLGNGWNFSPNKTGKYYAKFSNDSMNLKCKFTYDSISIIVPTAKLDANIIKTNVTCFQFKNGKIDIEGKGGIPPYKYAWSTGSIETKLSSLDIGIYTCTITDSIDCKSIHAVTITEPKLLTVTYKQINKNHCDAEWKIIVDGGTKPYNVSFDGNPAVITNDTTIFCVKVGSHTINVVDANDCKASFIDEFKKKLWPIKENIVDVCFGQNYKIGNSTYDKDGIYYDTLKTNIHCGTCDTVWKTTLDVLDLIKVTASVSSLTICGQGKKTVARVISVTGGSSKIYPNSGGRKYYYKWSNGSQGFEDSLVLTSDYFTLLGNTSLNLSVTVVDALGCQGNVDIGEINYAPEFKVTLDVINKCSFTGCEGTAAISNPNPDHTFLWSNGQKTPTADGLCASNTYTVTVTDKKGCTSQNNINVENPISVGIYGIDKKVFNPLCKGSKATVDIKFGLTGPGANNMALYTVVVNGDTLKIGANFSYKYSAKGPGTYKFKIYKYLSVGSPYAPCSTDTTLVIPEIPSSSVKVVQKDSLCEGATIILTTIASNKDTCKWYDTSWKQLGAANASLNVSKASVIYLVQASNTGCRDTIKHTVTEFENPKIELNGGVLCSDVVKLEVKLSNNPKNDSIVYIWNPTNANISTLQASKIGTYAVTVVNTKTGCKANTFSKVESSNNWIPELKQTQKLCDGKISILKSNIAKGVNTTWYKDGVEISGTKDLLEITVSSAGNYQVKAVDGICKGESKIFEVMLFLNPNVSLAQDSTICNKGKMTLTAQTTTGGLTYIWSNGENQKDITVGKGSYSVTATDANGCIAVASTNLGEYQALEVEIVKPKKLCPGESITLSLTNTYDKYEWSDGSKLATLTTNKSGVYSVTVTNDKGCTAVAKDSLEDATPVIPVLKTEPVCYNAKGIVSITNTSNFKSYTWNDNTTNATIPFEKEEKVTVKTIDKNGCPAEDSINTKMFPKPTATPISPKVCQDLNGKISLKEIFSSYLWNDKSIDSTLSVKTTGTYYVTVTDANGCTTDAFAAVTILPNPKPSISGPSTVCVGDAVTLEVDKKDFTNYLWSDNNVSKTFTAIYPTVGTYSVTVIDANGCVGTDSKTVSTADGLTVKMDTKKVCAGEKVTLNPGKYDNYLWSDGSTAQTIDVTKPGTYKVSVSIGNCKGVGEVTVEYFDLPAPKITGKDLPCFGKKTTLQLNGYSNIVWSTGEINKDSISVLAGIYSATVTDANGCKASDSITITERPKLIPEVINDEQCEGLTATLGLKQPFTDITWVKNGEKTQSIKVTEAGTYIVKVIDTNGCQGENFAKAIFNPLPQVKATAEKTPVCPNQQTTINAQSLTAIKYNWSNSVTAKNQTVGFGSYAVTVTDDKGCKASDTIVITEFKPISVVLDVKNLKLCAKDSSTISLKFNGLDNKKATVTLSDGAGFLVIKNVLKDTTFSYKPNNDKTLSIQTVSVEGYDCDIVFDKNQKFEIKVSKLYATLTAKSPKCFGLKDGSLSLNTNSSNVVWSQQSFGSEKIINNLVEGYFSVTVTDDLGCSLNADATLKEPKPISATLDVKNLKLCSKDSSTITLKFNGLEGRKANITLANGFVIKNIAKDTTFIYKPDTDKTVSIQAINVEGFDCAVDFDKNNKFDIKVSKLYGSIIAKSPKCGGVKNGSLNLNTNSTNIKWSTAFGSEKIINNLSTGYFTVTLSDDLGCSLNLSATLTEPKPIELSVTSTKTCVGQKQGSFEMKTSGGTGALKYYVQGKPYDDGKMSNLTAGIYTIMVKDSEGCTSNTDKVTIENYPVTNLTLDAGDTTSVVEGYDSLQIKAIITVDGRKVTDVLDENFKEYQWTPYDCPNCLSIFARTDSATTYKLRITDQYGCKVEDKIRIGVDKLVKEVDYPNAVTEGNPFKILNPNRSVKKFNALRVFDRWGNMMYQELNFKPNQQIGWDGSFRGVNCEPGVYVWIAVAEFLDGSIKIFKGDITVVGTAE